MWLIDFTNPEWWKLPHATYDASEGFSVPPRACECHACIKQFDLRGEGGGLYDRSALPLSMTKMIVCPKCGNKRCPHASDHRLDCTNSNEPGQPGSVYA